MKTLKTLEFNKICNQLANLALSENAKKLCENILPAKTLAEAQRRMAETTKAKQVMEAAGNPPLSPMTNLDKILDLVQAEGLLNPEQLSYMALFLASCKRMAQYMHKAEIACAILDMSDIRDEIDRCIRNGQMDDRASSALYDLRRNIAARQEQIKAKLHALMQKNRKYFSENFIAQRGGRLTLPVKREYRNAVAGTVVEMSNTGGTCFIEPSAVGKLQDELHQLYIDEDIEVQRLLYTLTAYIAENLNGIKINRDAMEQLDFLFAKAKLSLAMGAGPVDLTEERTMRILQARHPLLDKETAVPLDFALDGAQRGIIITGPNTGGKTIALKTVGLLTVMAQSGLHVPAQAESTFCIQDAVFCDIGDGQSIEDNLSTFSAHMTNILSILQSTTDKSLVLLDELGSGTDPAEGMGIAIAVLEELHEKGCLFVATTHYPEVKGYAARKEGLMNARMAFDRESLRPLYRLEIGVAGESCALYIAQRLGMPRHMLERARAAVQLPGETLPEGDILTVAPLAREVVAQEAAPPRSARFSVGDSVMVYPQKEIGIVYAPANEKGEVGVKIKGKNQLVKHKRLQLKVAAAELYPEDYDMAVVLDNVANRKARRILDRRHQAGTVVVVKEGK